MNRFIRSFVSVAARLLGGLLLLFGGNLQADLFRAVTEGELVHDGGASVSSSWIDINGDGYLDLYVGNAIWGVGENNFLYFNNGDGTFTKETGLNIVNDGGETFGHCWGDYDNDGDYDLYLTEFAEMRNKFYVNNGDGTFQQITGGIAVNDFAYSNNASWIDYDNDGDLDLYVTHQGHSGPPYAAPNALYRNDGGSFTKITSGAIVTDAANSHGQAWADYDNDGDLDLFVANFIGNGAVKNCLYQNNGDGTFAKITSGEIVNDLGYSLGPAWGDYDNDGDFDLFVANSYSMNPNFLYNNNGDGSFTKVTTGEVVTDGDWTPSAYWVDIDNDGDLDLFLSEFIEGQPQNSYNIVYFNDGYGNLERLPWPNPLVGGAEDIITTPGMYWGFSWGDYDRDGDLDLFSTRAADDNEDNILFENILETLGTGNGWIEITCVGTVSNRSAIGTKVRVKAKARTEDDAYWQLQQVTSSTGYMSQHQMSLHFGLGEASVIDSIQVLWPSGIVLNLANVPGNQFLQIEESCCGRYTNGMSGNADCSTDGKRNLADITRLIDRVYVSKTALCCEANGDVDGDEEQKINLADITRLIDYVYVSKEETSPCR